MGKGFTLVELAIVLVIIGLLVGAVVAGQELIKQSEYRAQVRQFTELNTAVNAFRTKYGCLPGDCRRATTFFTASSQPDRVTNGDGDGIINVGLNTVNVNAPAYAGNNTEGGRLLDHLAAAQLVAENTYDETIASSFNTYPPIGLPTTKIKSHGVHHQWGSNGPNAPLIIGYFNAISYLTAGHKFYVTSCTATPNSSSPRCGFNSSEARILDQKVDDGRPASGKMVIISDYYVYRIPAQYAENGSVCATWPLLTNNSYLSTDAYSRPCHIAFSTEF